MYAYEIPNLRFSLPSGGAVAMNRFVVVNASSQAVQALADKVVIGVSMNETILGQVQEIADGIVMVTAGAIVAAGASVSSDANGKAITAVAGSIAGIAITASTAADQLIAVKIK